MFIHHEVIEAKTAPDSGDGQGRFDVIEYGPRDFVVVQSDGGMTLSRHTNLRAAIAAAKREAKAYDQDHVAPDWRK